MDKIRILYYLEDRAQEGFITALVKKIAEEENIPESALENIPRSTRGGSRSIKVFIDDFRKFIIDMTKALDFDLIVVSVDGNCQGYNERTKEVNYPRINAGASCFNEGLLSDTEELPSLQASIRAIPALLRNVLVSLGQCRNVS